MLQDYALVKDGEVVETRDWATPPEASEAGTWLPLVVGLPTHDPTSEVVTGRAFTVEAEQVVGGWTVRAMTPDEIAEAFEARREAKRQAVRDRRAQCEVGGFDGPGGVRLRSDEKSQGKIAGLVTLFDKDAELTQVDFEAQPGVWVTVDQATADAVGVALGRHLQACFSHSRTLDEALAAADDDAALSAVDIEAGWPG